MKLKFHYTICVLLFYSITSYGQNWTSLNGGANNSVYCIFGDTLNNILYATGDFTEVGGISANKIAKWNGVTWDSIGNGLLSVLGSKHAFTLYNGELIAANCMFSYTHPHIAKWDGVQWDSIGNNFIPYGGTFYGIITLNGELYAYGEFDSINHIYYNSIAKWNGQDWVSIGFPFRFNVSPPSISCMAFYNNELYVGGAFSDTIAHMVNIAKYDGTTWSVVGGGFNGSMDEVVDLAVYQGELYAAGNFSLYDGNEFNFIARWNGNAWNDVGGGVTSPGNGQINDLLVLNNKLYAGGVFTEIGGISARHIASWDGTNWCGFGNTDNASVGCLASINNDLYLTCNNVFDGVTVNRIAKWIGGNYVDTCGNTTGIKETTQRTNELTIYPNPANSQITIDFTGILKGALIEIKNALGETIYAEKSQIFSPKTIDISVYPNGVYFIEVQNGNSITVNKFVKQ